MIVDSMRSYSDSDRIPFFDEGESVYLKYKDGSIEGPFTITSRNLSLALFYMYSFEETTKIVGENYLVRDLEDEPYSISECSRDVSGISEEILSSHKFIHGGRGRAGQMTLQFFQPDQTMIKWLVKYAAGRMIIDVGCGSGVPMIWMMHAGARICGVDPFWDEQLGSKMNMQRIMDGKDMIHVFAKKIEDMPSLFVGQGDKILLLFARPCHSDFVIKALRMKDAATEALYITVPQNIEKYADLGSYQDIAVQVTPEGRSVESEVFYSIR